MRHALLNAAAGNPTGEFLVTRASLKEYENIAVRFALRNEKWFAHIGLDNGRLFYESEINGRVDFLIY
jgi:hypothetical protein